MKLMLLAAAATIAAGVSACGATVATRGPAEAETASATHEFRNEYLAFSYPTSWRAEQPSPGGVALHVQPIVYLSLQPTGDPCRRVGTTTTCGWPVKQLQPGGVLIVWENRGYPGWTLESTPGTAIRVGGRLARRLVGRPGICAAIGGDETVQVAIARPIEDNWTAFTACLRGPALAERELEVDAVLASTRFASP